jgi:hypothetical protein
MLVLDTQRYSVRRLVSSFRCRNGIASDCRISLTASDILRRSKLPLTALSQLLTH